MAHTISDYAVSYPSLLSTLKVRFAGLRAGYDSYRQKRAVYLRTLRELQSYRPHELADLRVQTADFEAIARLQAGL